MNQSRFDLLEKFIPKYYIFMENGVFSVKSSLYIGIRCTKNRRHPYVTLSSKEVSPKAVKYPIHEIVGYLKFGKQLIGMTIDHKDNNPSNYSWDNLQLMTLKDNARKQGNSYIKLTEDQVKEVRKMLSEGYTQGQVAKLFPVNRQAISKIKLGKRWEVII